MSEHFALSDIALVREEPGEPPAGTPGSYVGYHVRFDAAVSRCGTADVQSMQAASKIRAFLQSRCLSVWPRNVESLLRARLVATWATTCAWTPLAQGAILRRCRACAGQKIEHAATSVPKQVAEERRTPPAGTPGSYVGYHVRLDTAVSSCGDKLKMRVAARQNFPCWMLRSESIAGHSGHSRQLRGPPCALGRCHIQVQIRL